MANEDCLDGGPLQHGGGAANADARDGGPLQHCDGATTTTGGPPPTTEAPTTTTPGPPTTTPAPVTTTEAPTTTTGEATTTTPGADLVVTVNGAEATDLCLRRVRASYTRPWECELFQAGRHDGCPAARLWDEVLVTYQHEVIFRGNVTETRPGGVAGEGVVYLAQCKRFRLENEPVRINGRGHYVWNRRGHTCEEGQGGEDSPGQDGEKWTAGEIVVDILEHALGLPAGGSDIAGHHGAASCVSDSFLTAADVAGYNAATILTLDSVIGEFSVDDTPIADAIGMLLGLGGGFWGWYINPASGNLIVQDLDALAASDIQAGEFGAWQDAGGTDYRLLGNDLTWSLDGVCSTIRIQGTDRTDEEQPANIEGDANPGAGNLGELEHVATPWKDFACAYRALAQPTRRFTTRPIDVPAAYTPPAGWLGFDHNPRIYVGTDAGAKTIYHPGAGNPWPRWMVPSGIIGFYDVPALGVGEKLWGWYWADVPFVVEAGPAGDAWAIYGRECVRTVYDPGFKHTTTWPQAGTADDEVAMGVLAERLLRLYRDVRRQGTLTVDEVDVGTYNLDARYNVVNLGLCDLTTTSTTSGATTTSPGATTTTPYEDPMRWSRLRLNAVEVEWDFENDLTAITVANTFFMLEEYSEMKRRMEMNLFARRELDLSESIFDCVVREAAAQSGGDDQVEDTTTSTTTSTTAEATTTTQRTIGTIAETEAAQSDSYSGAPNTVVHLIIQTRDAYNDAGDQKFYSYYRTLTFPIGAILGVTAETRVTIDEPDECCT